MVSTIASSWRARTKHSPRWPSCSLQKRGQTSHCTRPSAQPLPVLGGNTARMSKRSRLLTHASIGAPDRARVQSRARLKMRGERAHVAIPSHGGQSMSARCANLRWRACSIPRIPSALHGEVRAFLRRRAAGRRRPEGAHRASRGLRLLGPDRRLGLCAARAGTRAREARRAARPFAPRRVSRARAAELRRAPHAARRIVLDPRRSRRLSALPQVRCPRRGPRP